MPITKETQECRYSFTQEVRLLMIILHLESGMGNQMFMYAAGLAVARRLGTELVFERIIMDAPRSKNRHYALDCFPAINIRSATMLELIRICPLHVLMELITYHKGIRKQDIFRRLIRKVYNKFFSGYGVFQTHFGSYNDNAEKLEDVRDNMCMVGYWESEKNFASISDLVREKFTFAPEYFDTELTAKIKSCNSVALHVRRGDKAGKVFSRVFLPSDERYIKFAVDKILSLTETPSFFVFSDDIAWCRENLPQIHEAEYTFVDGQSPAQDMALMSICRHVIMGPSTFSWWGAWLNEYPGKIIIAPDINLWYKPGTFEPNDRKNLLPERWIKIQ